MSSGKILTLIVIFLFGFITSTYAQQDKPTIQKGQLLPVPQIVRSIMAERIARELTSTIFDENFETKDTSWATSGSWAIGSPTSGPYGGYNSTNCAATNLSGEYTNYADDWLISPSISLPMLTHTSSRLMLNFWEWFEIESGYDHGMVKISIDGGTNWTELDDRSGSSGWRQTFIDLSSYAGKTIKLAFHLTSDYAVTYSGWYVDNVQIVLEEPQPLRATLISLNHQNFPFIYMNVAVDTFGVGIANLTQSNFQVYENNVLQTDYFEVTPPQAGGGVRLADIVFLMDNSGSMSEEQNAIRNNVIDFVNNLAASGIDFALGLCRFGADENNGYPIIEDNGILTNDAEYFKNILWAKNVIDGGYEPGWDALYQSANSFSFRPGSQKIFILITDESPNYASGGASTNYGRYSKSETIGMLQSNSITVFALIPQISEVIQDYGTIAETMNGKYFDIYSPFDEILDYISSQVANTYLIRYKSNNPIFDGTLRTVEVNVSYSGNIDTVSGTYIPGSAPIIQRTQATLDLHNRSWAEGTEFTIEAEITDNVEPYVQSATLYYRTTGAGSYSSTIMNLFSGDIYRGTIPGSAVRTPGLDYYITATDGQTTSSDPSVDPTNNPYQIAILPNVAPTITHTPVTTLTPGNPITITAEIVDNTNYVSMAKLYYRKTGQLIYQSVDMINTIGNTYKAEIPSNYVTMDGVDYYIFAKDDLGVGNYSGTPDNPYKIEQILLLPPPNLLSPGLSSSPGELIYSLNPSFLWNSVPGADQYGLYIRDMDTGELIFDSQLSGDIIKGTEYTLPSGVLEWGKHYRWNMNSYNEIGWGEFSSPLYFYTAQLDSLSKIIKEEMQDKITVSVDGKNYYIVTIRKYIDPLTWETSDYTFLNHAPAMKKVYTDSNFTPISDTLLIKKIALIDRANNLLNHIGKPESIQIQINTINNVFESDRDLANAELISDVAKHLAFTVMDLVIFIELGKPVSIVNEISSTIWDEIEEYTDPEKFMLMIGRALLEGAIKGYENAKKIAEENEEGIYNYDTAKDYLNYFYNAHFKFLYGAAAVLPRDRIDQNAFWKIVGWMPDYIIHLGTMLSSHSPIFKELFGSVKSIIITDQTKKKMDEYRRFLNNVADIPYKVAQLLKDESFPLDYTQALTYKDITKLSRWGIIGVDEINVNLGSPGELIVYDSNNNITGKIKGEIRIEIPNSFYYNNEVTIFLPNDAYAIKVIGTDIGRYKLDAHYIEDKGTTTFAAIDIPISANAVYQYTIDWDALSQGRDGVMVQIDSNGDGKFERSFTTGSTLTVEAITPSTRGKLNKKNVYFYPNPFNPDKTFGIIRYSLSKPGDVSIKIYDNSNRLVTTIICGYKEAGIELSKYWNGRNDKGDIVSNGIYFYVIESSSGEKAVGKIAVLR